MSDDEAYDSAADSTEVPVVVEDTTTDAAPMKKVRNNRGNKRQESKKDRDILDKLIVSRCSAGERNCRACAKGFDHKSPPAHITCIWCGSIHHFYRIRTGRIRREKIYYEDDRGDRISKYNKNGDFVGHYWRWGDKMYYEDGTPVPETKFTIACGADSCKFYKIPVGEVQQYNVRTKGNLEKV